VTQEVNGSDLAFAITSEARRRSMEPFTTFVAPAAWGLRYVRMAKSVPYCAEYRTVAKARELMAAFIDPVLSGAASDRTWSPSQRAWL